MRPDTLCPPIMPTELEEVCALLHVEVIVFDYISACWFHISWKYSNTAAWWVNWPSQKSKTDIRHSCRKSCAIFPLPACSIQDESAASSEGSEAISSRLQSLSNHRPQLDITTYTFQQIARDAITILINLSTEREVLEYLASDKEFIKMLLGRVTVCQSPGFN